MTQEVLSLDWETEFLPWFQENWKPGEHVSIVAPTGAGKTTFIDLIAKRLRPTSGRIYFKDKDITNLPPYRISSLGIGK